MKLDEAFPSNYVKSSDIKGRDVKVIIDDYKMEELGDERKLVLYFQHASKGMVLNKTNASEIAEFYGDDLDKWIGRPIELYVARVDFQRKKVDGLRVRIPQQNGAQTQQRQPDPMPVAEAQKPALQQTKPAARSMKDMADDAVPF